MAGGFTQMQKVWFWFHCPRRRLRPRVHPPATRIRNGRATPRDFSNRISCVNNMDLTPLPSTP